MFTGRNWEAALIRTKNIPEESLRHAPVLCPWFQFDVKADGTVGKTLSFSVPFSPVAGDSKYTLLQTDSVARDMMRKAQAWGIADDRWQRLSEMRFFRRLPGAPGGGLLFCYPAFLKLKWNDGVLFDAKSYLRAAIWGGMTSFDDRC